MSFVCLSKILVSSLRQLRRFNRIPPHANQIDQTTEVNEKCLLLGERLVCIWNYFDKSMMALPLMCNRISACNVLKFVELEICAHEAKLFISWHSYCGFVYYVFGEIHLPWSVERFKRKLLRMNSSCLTCR